MKTPKLISVDVVKGKGATQIFKKIFIFKYTTRRRNSMWRMQFCLVAQYKRLPLKTLNFYPKKSKVKGSF